MPPNATIPNLFYLVQLFNKPKLFHKSVPVTDTRKDFYNIKYRSFLIRENVLTILDFPFFFAFDFELKLNLPTDALHLNLCDLETVPDWHTFHSKVYGLYMVISFKLWGDDQSSIFSFPAVLNVYAATARPPPTLQRVFNISNSDEMWAKPLLSSFHFLTEDHLIWSKAPELLLSRHWGKCFLTNESEMHTTVYC